MTLQFYSERSDQSRVKAEIISKYFSAWATVVRGYSTKISYIDLFAGRGRYDDGSESTPLLVLRRAIDDPVVSQMLVSLFNDKDHAAALKAEIGALPGIEKLKYEPAVSDSEVAEDTAKVFQSIKLVPTLAFIDPWGYRGLSRELIQALLKDWGCDLVFFFNYNRINMGLTNKKVAKHMEAIFGPAWLAELRQAVPGLRPARRQRVVLAALRTGLRELGGEFVRSFRFLRQNGRTSHYLIFVTKDFKGVEIMRGVMAGMSSTHVDGVASFAYDPRPRDDTQMEIPPTSPLDRLKARIIRDLAGTRCTVREIFERHSSDGRFTLTNYKEALRRLEAEGKVYPDPPASKRQRRDGQVTMADRVRVSIPAR